MEEHPSRGFWKYCRQLRKGRPDWNPNRIYRVYKAMKLSLRRTAKRRLPTRGRVPLYVPRLPDSVWSVDFMSDALACGRRFRTFNVVDAFNREVHSLACSQIFVNSAIWIRGGSPMPSKISRLLRPVFIAGAISAFSNGAIAADNHLAHALKAIVENPSQESCIALDGKTNSIRQGVDGVDSSTIGKLFGRLDVDVSPIGFATLVDSLEKGHGEVQYGSLPPNSGLNEPSIGSDARMAVNEARDVIGLVPVEVERQVYRDLRFLGRDPTVDLVDARSILECRLQLALNTAKKDLQERIKESNSARSAWQKDGFSTNAESFSRVKVKDAKGAEWVRKLLLDDAYRNGAGFGRRDLFNIFLLIQHSGDLELMEKALPWVANMMIEGRIARSNYALMVDRIAVFKGLDQVYGTQGTGEEGHYVPQRIESPEEVDERRALMRMRTLSDYYNQLNN